MRFGKSSAGRGTGFQAPDRGQRRVRAAAVAAALLAARPLAAQVTFDTQKGTVQTFGSAERNGLKDSYRAGSDPLPASGNFPLLELPEQHAHAADVDASSAARLTQDLRTDPADNLPLLSVTGLATARASTPPPFGDADNVSAHAFITYDVSFTLTSPESFHLTGLLDAATGQSQAAIFLAPFSGRVDESGNPLPGTPLFSFTANNQGAPPTVTLDQSGTLQAGKYFIGVTDQTGAAIQGINGGGVASRDGRSAFNFLLDFGAAGPAAADVHFINPRGGSFGDVANWNPQRVPVKDASHVDTAIFDQGGSTYTVNAAADQTMERLVVRDDTVDFTGGGKVTLKAADPTPPSVSIQGTGRLNIANRRVAAVHAVIGDLPPGLPASPPTAEVLVANGTSEWDLSGNLAVGGAGRGKLFVANGGTVVSAAATIGGAFGGEAAVGGQNSLWDTGNLAVGIGGAPGTGGAAVPSTFDVEAGATVDSDDAVIGVDAASSGAATIDGANSTWNVNGALTVGKDGAGTLAIRAGGLVALQRAAILVGEGPGTAPASVTVSGKDSTLVNQVGDLNVGGARTASLRVEDGGIVEVIAGNAKVGAPADLGGLPSQVVVTGVAASGGRSILEVGGTLDIASGADASLLIQNGALVRSGKSSVGTGQAPRLTPANGHVVIEGVSGSNSSTWTVNGLLTLADEGQATLTVRDGGLLNLTAGLTAGFNLTGGGPAAGSAGLVVSGRDSSVVVQTRDTIFGFGGPAALLVENGAAFNTFAGDFDLGGDALVTGINSANNARSTLQILKELRVGAFGDGTLSVLDGGLLETGKTILGDSPRTGSVSIDQVGPRGVASSWKVNGELIIGKTGVGTVTVGSGGVVNVTGANVVLGEDNAASTNNSLTVSGAGSVFSAPAATALVGFVGGGRVSVRGGATVTFRDMIVGGLNTGSVAVSGTDPGSGAPSALTMTGNLVVGNFSAGTLLIEGGGAVRAAGVTLGAPDAGGVGLIDVNGSGPNNVPSLLHADTNIAVGGPGLGSLTLRGGRVEAGGNVTINAGSSVAGNGTLAVASVINNGFLSPGLSPGRILLIGNYAQQPGGTLDIEMAGLAPGTQFDQLVIQGGASLDGSLVLDFINGFAPHAGDRFEFLSATGGLTGRFSTVDLRDLAPGFQFDLRSDGGRMELVALSDGVAVPEPGSAGLIAGAAILLLRRRRAS